MISRSIGVINRAVLRGMAETYYIKNRKMLTNKDFTLISNNCWGTFVYKGLHLQYRTPFVGLFLFAPDYMRLLENFTDYMSKDMKFTGESRYKQHIDYDIKYPVGLLDDLEVHFVYSKDNEDAVEKWDRRRKRINWDNIYYKFCDRDLCTPELIERFFALPYKNKVCFTAHPYDNCVVIDDCRKQDTVFNEQFYYYKYFNVVQWLNGNNK
jgi:uncharacterized protein (DUF1919 family)